MNPSDSSCEIQSDPTSASYHAMILEVTNALFSSDWNQLKSSAPVVNRSISGMDVKVFKAAREGNIDALREHSDYLHQMLTPTKSTVLHVYIARVGGALLTKSEELLLKSAQVVREMLKICQRLLLQPNDNGDTALHLAARHGRSEIVEVLIQAAKDWHGDLEEGTSSTEGCHRFLIRRTNKEKNTALHEAVRFDHLHVVKILTGEDPEFLYSANDAGETPLYIAAEKGYRKSVFEILDTCTNLSYQGPDGLTALHVAAVYGDEQITGRLLEKEKTLALAAVDGDGTSPLHFAAFGGYVSIVKQILESDNSTAYIGDIRKLVAVHYAAIGGRVDVMKQLLLYCPDSFELVDYKGRNALHYAIHSKKYKVEEFVRKDPWLSSILLNSKDFRGNTPLHQIAKSEDEYNGLEFIRDSRVDKMVFNNENMNAINIIVRSSAESRWKRNLKEGMIDSGARVGHRREKERVGGSEVHAKRGDKESSEDSKYKEIKESHLVVSALIATVTFAAGFTVPGGYQSEKGPDQGFAVLSRNAAFKAFVISNTLAMSMSSSAVMIRFFLLVRRREFSLVIVPRGAAIDLTMYALIAMVVAFLTGTYAVLGSHSSLGLAIAATVLGCFFFFGFGAFLFVPAFSALRGFSATIYLRVAVFLYHFMHGNFYKLVPKRKF
uniref:ankyrin repeat-containing protein At5g02620-like n=1 Tax=Fragaria vesca subsp. vesca TaxID=101020 RepID=UPI0005C841A1|nr:PREDICTED: ankyrin repeat-containing protein At5g02620-like [Fragaria vesca subsp. vesca]